jgi:hypothetical protein
MRGTSALSLSSQMVTYQVKQDGYVRSLRVLPLVARRVAENLAAYPFLQACLGEEITLVPMPRSSLQRPGFLWPVQRICECWLAEGLGRDIEPCLIRTAPLLKASLAVPGQRPHPIDHYHSTTVRHSRRSAPRTITLVDDVVTRGASFIGMYARLREAYPNAQIRCFALIRTIRSGEIDQILIPSMAKSGMPMIGFLAFHDACYDFCAPQVYSHERRVIT